MRLSKFSLPLVQLSFFTATLGLGSVAALSGCTNSMDMVDDGTDKRRDLTVTPPSDLASSDLAGAPDLSTRGDMATTGSDMGSRDMATSSGDMAGRDMAMTSSDMAMSGGDMASRDLAMTSSDLAAAPDLATTTDGGRTYTCRGSDAPGAVYQLVTDSLTLPKGTGTTYVYDFDGSGKPKNALKALMQFVNTFGLDLQTPISDAVKAGSVLQLASLTTDNLTTASCAGVSIVPAKTTLTPPKFDGTDVLERYPLPSAELIGSLTAGLVSTKASKDLLPTEDAVLPLQLRIGPMSLVLPLHGVHAEGTLTRTGSVNRITGGMLNGVVSATDIDSQVIPGLASAVTTMINTDPMSPTTKILIPLFENMANPVSAMKCMMPTLCCSTNPATCTILAAEVKMSWLGGFLKPDVQAFDTMGNWSPAPAGTTPNGFTVGIGFSAVSATYP